MYIFVYIISSGFKMANWICGDLKVRGTKGNIKRFLLEGLMPVPEGIFEQK